MAVMKRHLTGYPGVFYILGRSRGNGDPERVYYVNYYRHGRRVEEKAGRASEGMTPARANILRAMRMKGAEPTNQERREAERAARIAERNRWTLGRLWAEYASTRTPGKALDTDAGRFEKYLKPQFENVEPKDIQALDVERVKRRLMKDRSAQTVRHVLNLLTVVVGFGVKSGLCQGMGFHVRKPAVHNVKTEDLTQDQLKRLISVIEENPHGTAECLMLMALYTGMRRGELFKLEWRHIDLERGFILIEGPKGGRDQIIPMNQAARALLDRIPRTGSPYVFPGRGGGQRRDINKALASIRERAGLPEGFRPLHGLRHVFASQLASSGEVDMYTLQRLLTHKDPRMTQRYAHLRDETLRKASELAGETIEAIIRKR